MWRLWAAPPESSFGGKPGLGAVGAQGRPKSSVHLGGNEGPYEGLSTVEQAGSPALQNIPEHPNPQQPGPESRHSHQLVPRETHPAARAAEARAWGPRRTLWAHRRPQGWLV